MVMKSGVKLMVAKKKIGLSLFNKQQMVVILLQDIMVLTVKVIVICN